VPLKYVRGHYRPSPPVLDYIVDKSGCWVWAGCKDSAGYGVTRHEGRTVRAHRRFFELHNRTLAKEEVVRHVCDNPPCVNPSHLLAGSAKDNTQDAVARGRMARGERQGAAKLTLVQVHEIKKALRSGKTIASLGRQYNVNPSTIGNIKKGKTWGWVSD
jgi:hypothetical protein